MSRATELTEDLGRFLPRPAGSDAERRAAGWAARELAADPRRSVRIQTLWLRPHWAAAQVWHLALAVAGGVVTSTSPKAGAAMVFAALLFTLVDWTRPRLSPGRWLTREHATQNVLSRSSREAPVRLILTAHLDTGRHGETETAPLGGWLFWDVVALVAALAGALWHVQAGRSTPAAILQAVATVALVVLATWLLLSRRRVDDGAGVAAALTLARLLDSAPPAHLGVDVVLTGAGSGEGLGLRRHLQGLRRTQNATNTVVLGFGPGTGAYHLSADGPLLAMNFFGPLREMAAAAGLEPRLSHGCSPALPGRLRRWPSLGVGGDPDAVVSATLELVDAIDAYVRELRRPAAPTPAR